MLFRPVPTDPDHQPDQKAEDDQFYRDILHELIHIGTDLARLTHLHAVAHAQAAVQGRAPTEPASDHATAFDRTARAVRRCVTLARSLGEPPPAPARDRTAPHPAAARTPTPHEAGDATVRAAAAGRDDRPEAPSADRRDRPEAPDRDAPDLDEDITGRPPAAVIAGIRRDLGLDAAPGAHLCTPCTPADTGPRTRAAPSAAAPSSTRQPGTEPQAGPQGPGDGNTQHSSSPEPDQPAPVQPGYALPDDPAEAVTTILCHPNRIEGRWRPPPSE